MIRHGTVKKGECHFNVKLTEDEVIEIRRLYSTKRYTQVKLAEIFDVSQQHMCDIVNKRRWEYLV